MAARRPISTRGWVLECVLAAVFLGFAPQTLRAQMVDACGPAPEVKTALDALPSYATPNQTEKQFRAEKQAQIEALLRRFPDDLFVQRAYINMQTGTPGWDDLIAKYKARSEQHPDNPQWAYLYGLTLIGRRTPDAIKLLEGALEKGPKFAWAHLKLAEIYTSPNFKNQEKAVSNLEAFLGACPSTFDGYDRLTRLDDKELIRQSAEKLRAILAARSDSEAVGAYSTLWSLEFKAHPPSEYEPLRKQVAADLQRIRALNLQDKDQWYGALEEGYKLVNDQKQSDLAKDERQKRFPRLWELAAAEKWFKDHHYPSADDPPDKQKAYYRDLLKESAEWVKERPNTAYMWWYRLDAMELLDDVPTPEVEATVDKTFQVAEANADPFGIASDTFFSIAEILSKKGIQPEREVEMAQKGLAQLEVETKRPPSDLYYNKKDIDSQNFYNASQRVQGLVFETDAYLKLRQAEKAQQELARLNQRLLDLNAQVGEKEGRQKAYARQQASYWGLMARLAESQGRKQDAMAFYGNALLTRLKAGVKPNLLEKDELADNARQLWTSLGGTDEGWQMWYARPAAELASKTQLTWEKASDPLPSFKLTDLRGKTWQLADLKGKEVFLNFWASW